MNKTLSRRIAKAEVALGRDLDAAGLDLKVMTGFGPLSDGDTAFPGLIVINRAGLAEDHPWFDSIPNEEWRQGVGRVGPVQQGTEREPAGAPTLESATAVAAPREEPSDEPVR